MSKEYIEKEAAINAIEDTSCYLCKKYIGTKKCNCDCEIWRNKKMLHCIPAADVKPVVRGKWLDYAARWDLRRKRHDYRCPKCGNRADYFVCGMEEWWCAYEPNYCPNCGADMREAKDDE